MLDIYWRPASMANMKNKANKINKAKAAKVWWFIVGEIHKYTTAKEVYAFDEGCREQHALAVKAPNRVEDAIAAWSDAMERKHGWTGITVCYKTIVRCGATKPKDFSGSFDVEHTGILAILADSQNEKVAG